MGDITVTYENGLPSGFLIDDPDSRLGEGIRVDVSDIDAQEAGILRAQFSRMSSGEVTELARDVNDWMAYGYSGVLKREIENRLDSVGISARVDDISSYRGRPSGAEGVEVSGGAAYSGPAEVEVSSSALDYEYLGTQVRVGLKGVTEAEAEQLEQFLESQSGAEIIEAMDRLVQDDVLRPSERQLADNLVEKAMNDAGITGDTTGAANIGFTQSPIR